MPLIASAIKKLRKDKKREKFNRAKKARVQDAIKKARMSKNASELRQAIGRIDKAVKVGIFHKNKASRLKSSLAKLIKPAAGISGSQKQKHHPKKSPSPKKKSVKTL